MSQQVDKDKIYTGNDQLIGSLAGKLVIMNPKSTLTKKEALLHAAWLVAMATDDNDYDHEEFEDILLAVESC